jgi:hypothetical protein
MLPEHEELIIKLKDRIYAVIMLYEKEKENTKVLLQEKQSLAERLGQVQGELKAVEGKYESLKLGKMIEASSKDEHDAKIKINRIVREIDQCIALLNR